MNVPDEALDLSIGIKKKKLKCPRYQWNVVWLIEIGEEEEAKNIAFDLIKKEWENSWLADKFAQQNISLTQQVRLDFMAIWVLWRGRSRERHKTCWRNKLWSGDAHCAFMLHTIIWK